MTSPDNGLPAPGVMWAVTTLALVGIIACVRMLRGAW